MRIKLSKKWVNPADAKEHTAGEVLELEDAVGSTLVSAEVGEKVADAGDVKSVLDEAITGFELKIEDAVAKAVKRASNAFTLKGGHIEVGKDLEIDEDPKRGYKSFGDQLRDIKAACMPGARPSERLEKMVAAAKQHGGYEGVGAEGGFLVAPEFSNRMLSRVEAVLDLLGQCDTIVTQSNSVEVTASIDHDRSGTTYRYGGVIPYWQAEATAITASRALWRRQRIELHKLACLVPVSDELLEDVGGLGARLERTMGTAIGEECLFAVLFGDGAGKPTGVFTGAEAATDLPFVAVAKESGQTAATIVSQNIIKMVSRLYKGRGRWLYNPECFPQLCTMTINVGTGGVPVWLPANGLANQPNESLFGLRADRTDLCAALGTKGDIVALDPSCIIVARKGGIQTAMSIHLYFDSDETAFRATFRIGAASAWDRPLTPRLGAATVSPFVCLRARA